VNHHPGQFSGELNMISGRHALGRLRVSEAGEVIQLDREPLLALIQTDAEMSEILMRAFILRRLELIARDLGRRDRDPLGAQRGDTSDEAIPDPERPSLSLHRPRS
jgi:hypothetical protein